jgi:hypothetical protein
VAVAEEVEEVEEGMAVEDQNCVDSRRTARGKLKAQLGTASWAWFSLASADPALKKEAASSGPDKRV